MKDWILFYKNGPLAASVLLIFLRYKQFLHIKIVSFSGNRTRIVGVEGEPADDMNTTTAQGWIILPNRLWLN